MTHQSLEFEAILDMLAANALSEAVRGRLRALAPVMNLSLCAAALRETSDTRMMVEAEGLPPLAVTDGLYEPVRLAELETLLTPAQLAGIALFANTCRRMQNYLKKCELLRTELSLNGRAYLPLDDLEREIDACVRGDEIADSASTLLRDIRRRMDATGDRLRKKLSAILTAHPEWFADAYVTSRGGRLTLPLRAQFRGKINGAVIDRSQTGGTLFIEPEAAREAQDELDLLRIEADNEVRRILYALSAQAADAAPALRENMRLTEKLDFAFAKGKLSLEMNARAVPAMAGGALTIIGGRHPLLKGRAVPLDFTIGGPDGTRGVIITGPNTGGKTVALKTIGLFALMAQCGLHLPAEEGSVMRPFGQVLCDIGDGQSIAENLSTFSSHMTRVLLVLRTATKESLVLLDELGSGTDPAEGMGIAMAVLDELASRGCLFVATTHYPQIKEYARLTAGVQNARMAFDPETLSPLYTLKLGEAGESCALHIARKLGFPEPLLARARQAAYGGVLLPAGTGKSAFAGTNSKLITDYTPVKTAPERALRYNRGDSVRVYPEGQVGIVYAAADPYGVLIVQMRNGKRAVPYKRLRLLVKAEQLYPEDYDFSIVFDTVENRKARHVINRRYDENAMVHVETLPDRTQA
jgi:DNA mismatch repair protein MutS2